MAALALLIALVAALAGFGAATRRAVAQTPPPPTVADAAPAAPAAPPKAAAPDTSAPDNSSAEIEAQKKELESLRQELEKRGQLSKQLKGRERNILGDLRDTEKNLQLTMRYLAALERRRRAVMGDLGETTAWTEGQYVLLDDLSHAYWDGSDWEAGEAPASGS